MRPRHNYGGVILAMEEEQQTRGRTKDETEGGRRDSLIGTHERHDLPVVYWGGTKVILSVKY